MDAGELGVVDALAGRGAAQVEATSGAGDWPCVDRLVDEHSSLATACAPAHARDGSTPIHCDFTAAFLFDAQPTARKRVAPHLGRVGRPAYSARIYRPKDLEPVTSPNRRASLSFHVSLLGPYYGIHDTGEPDEIPAAVAEEIEATYPGCQPIPPELGNEVVPDVDMDGLLMGEATIHVCLFSNVWTWVDP